VLAARQDSYRQPRVVERRRGDRAALDGDVGADTEDSLPVGLGDDRRVHLGIVGGRDRIPRTGEVAVAVVTQRQGDSAHRLDRAGGRARNDVYVRSAGGQ
jgi:hypothetical protein